MVISISYVFAVLIPAGALLAQLIENNGCAYSREDEVHSLQRPIERVRA
jgi:hypothetical protein